jgi:ubiquinone biosynthesis protein UbiJ
MLIGLSTRLLQHLIAQNSWACPLLQPHAGKCVAFKLGFFSRSLIILEDGSLAMAGDSHVADASVSLTPSLALRLLSGDEAAKRQVTISGDTQLAAELAKVLSAMRWDFEDDASKLVGDVAAHKIGHRRHRQRNRQQFSRHAKRILARRDAIDSQKTPSRGLQ